MSRERILSDDEVETLRGLWATAPSIGYVAKQLGVCIETARKSAHQLGLVRPDPESAWSPEKVEKLIELVKEGCSGGLIAAKLGVSRNAVIGKVTRLGMRLGNSRNSQRQNIAAKLRLKANYRKRRKKAAKANAHVSRIEFQKEPIPAAAVGDVARVKFADLEPHHCRFGVGDPKRPDFGFCGLERAPGSSYCPVHTARCWVAVPVRKNQVPFREKVMT